MPCYSVPQTAEIGQIAYLASQINAEWQPLAGMTLTDDQYSGIWGRAWWALGDAAFTAAGNTSNGYSWSSRRDAYLQATNYMFTGRSAHSIVFSYLSKFFARLPACAMSMSLTTFSLPASFN